MQAVAVSSANDLPTGEAAAFATRHRASLTPFVEGGRMTVSEADACTRMANEYREQTLRGIQKLRWEAVAPLGPDNCLDLCNDHIALEPREASRLLSQVVALRLNGGLGTSMGCAGPKALVEVAHDASFLELVVRQAGSLSTAYGVQLPLVFMNSARTDSQTRQAVSTIQAKLRAEGRQEVPVSFFLQPVFPRLDPETLLPCTQLSREAEEELWYPPGHASVFESFVSSGLAASLRAAGKRWVFVSNVDNLGAWPDPRVLAAIEKDVGRSREEEEGEKRREEREDDKDGQERGPTSAAWTTMASGKSHVPVFYMETTKKTLLDVKGGAPVSYEGKPYLLEAVQVPEGHHQDFEDISTFELFNTGNLWIDLDAWLRMPPLSLPIIANPKTVATPSGSVKVLQLETGVGTALSVLPSRVLVVPRARFLPVKLTADLLRLRSDLYLIDTKTGFLKPTTDNLPEVRLSQDFAHVQDLERRVKGNVSLKDARRLVLDGNIVLEDGVKFIGDVEIHSHTDQPLELGTIYADVKIE